MRASRWPGSVWRFEPAHGPRHRRRRCRLGNGGTRPTGHQPRPRPAGRDQRRLDRRAHRHPGAALGGRGRVHRHPGHRGRRRRDQAGRPEPVRHRLLHRLHLHPRAADPADGAVRAGRARPALRRLRHRRRLLRLRLRAGRRRLDGGVGRLRPGAAHRVRDAQPLRRPRRPLHVHPLRRRRRRRRAGPRPTSLRCWPGTSTATGRRPRFWPSRQVGAASPPPSPRSPPATTSSRWTARRSSAGRCGPWSSSGEATLEKAGIGRRRPRPVVPHQANARIIDATASRLGLPPEQVFVNVDRYGNTSAASIPIAWPRRPTRAGCTTATW